eukprot:12985491-Ditylum_brightwellii.AAC.1
MLPMQHEQQQQHAWKSSDVLIWNSLSWQFCSSSYSLSHLTDTVYMCGEEHQVRSVLICIIYTMVEWGVKIKSAPCVSGTAKTALKLQKEVQRKYIKQTMKRLKM